MPAIISLFVAVTLSLLVTRIASEALTLTGLSRQSARFQARSAFTGSGFTTEESEGVVNHPVRRRIIMWLMFLGNAGIVTVISSVVLTFVTTARSNQWMLRILLLVLGLALLSVLIRHRGFNRYLNRLVRWALRSWTNLDVRDYANLLHLKGEYRVMELQVNPSDWLANKQLHQLRLKAEGIMVLGIQRRDKTYVGAPNGSTYIRPFDLLILYGRKTALLELDSRRDDLTGEIAHEKAVKIQKYLMNEQAEDDTMSSQESLTEK